MKEAALAHVGDCGFTIHTKDHTGPGHAWFGHAELGRARAGHARQWSTIHIPTFASPRFRELITGTHPSSMCFFPTLYNAAPNRPQSVWHTLPGAHLSTAQHFTLRLLVDPPPLRKVGIPLNKELPIIRHTRKARVVIWPVTHVFIALDSCHHIPPVHILFLLTCRAI